ncbi:uncharacterized protein LOC141555238 isoform X1 [Sminthopsis crassicaudata]|uniref:uncharacterized protein LOC141555238 isoform X1 n=1 Tax=Sminthopsis crassicaudata TaxID=9301 RepID=UPI003D6848AB
MVPRDRGLRILLVTAPLIRLTYLSGIGTERRLSLPAEAISSSVLETSFCTSSRQFLPPAALVNLIFVLLRESPGLEIQEDYQRFNPSAEADIKFRHFYRFQPSSHHEDPVSGVFDALCDLLCWHRYSGPIIMRTHIMVFMMLFVIFSNAGTSYGGFDNFICAMRGGSCEKETCVFPLIKLGNCLKKKGYCCLYIPMLFKYKNSELKV